jgi:preprotein translocase subunit YajC
MIDLLSRLPMLQEDPTTNMLMMLGTVGAVILVFYFLIIRPQNKKQKAVKDMLGSLRKNDKIVTIGGMRGTVTAVKEQTVIVKVDDNTKIEFNKNAVAQVLERKEEDSKEESE